eukprot:5365021-Pleurochrysis_carterae.AAC.1
MCALRASAESTTLQMELGGRGVMKDRGYSRAAAIVGLNGRMCEAEELDPWSTHNAEGAGGGTEAATENRPASRGCNDSVRMGASSGMHSARGTIGREAET